MIAVDVRCPECCHSPVNHLELIDGDIWICPECGYQELTAGVDIEAQLKAS